jgi:DnaJ homologue, subfamily C, member 28, conserved domain
MGPSTLVENRIKEAIEEGKFDNLSGSGRPLDLEEYFATPEPLRMAFSILKSAKCVPPEVELVNEIARLEHALANATDATERVSLQQSVNRRRIELAVRLERQGRPSPSLAFRLPADGRQSR